MKCGKIAGIDVVLYWNRYGAWNTDFQECGGCDRFRRLPPVRVSYVLQMRGMWEFLHTFFVNHSVLWE